MNTNVQTFNVKGMHCEGCENRVKKVLGEIPGVSDVKADHAKELVELQVSEDVSIENIRKKIKMLGYKIK